MKRGAWLIAFLLLTALSHAGISISSSTATQINLEFNLDSHEIRHIQDFSRISMPGYGFHEDPGAPALPYYEFKIGIPPYGAAKATILYHTEEEVELPARIAPEPYPRSVDGNTIYQYEIDEAKYRNSASNILEALGEQSFRDYHYIPFLVNPFIYDGHNKLRVITHATIQVQLQGNVSQSVAKRYDPAAEIVLDQLLNKEQAQYWQHRQRATVNYADFSRSTMWAKIETEKPGMHKISYSQLTDFPLGDIDPRTFRLFATSGTVMDQDQIDPGELFEELPIRVVGEEDGSFDTGDYIVFLGSDRTGYEVNKVFQSAAQSVYHNPYSHNSVFWLTFAGQFEGTPKRITSDTSNPPYDETVARHQVVVHVEEEAHRYSLTGYSWYMHRLFGSSTMDYTFSISLPELDSSLDQRLEMRFRQEEGGSASTHKIKVWVNNRLVPSNQADSTQHTWTGNSIFNFSRFTNAFVSGNNTIKIQAIRSGPDNYYLDFYRVTYTQVLNKSNTQFAVNADSGSTKRYVVVGQSSGVEVYQVKSPGNIRLLPIEENEMSLTFVAESNSQDIFYLLSSNEHFNPVSVNVMQPNDIATSDGAVQSIIVCPQEFINQAEELAQIYMENWGLRTKVVPQNDIFNQFSGGHPDPMAIRQYLRHVYYNFPEPKLSSLTLLGIGSMDWRNYSRVAAHKNKVMIFQDNSNGITSDDFFGMLTNITHPEIAIGRYPVSNDSELTTMIDNLRNYTQDPLPGLWRNDVLLLADDELEGDLTADWGHTVDMEALSQMLNPSINQIKIFAAEYESDEFLNKPRVRDEVVDHINDGVLIWFYVGHGAFDSLSMQNYFTGSVDLGRFDNPDQQILFITAACEVSLFDHWAYDSLGQKVVLLENAGAIASVGSTRKSFAGPNQELMTIFMPNMINSRMPLGLALTDAKIRHTGSAANDSYYVIFGDPNLHIVPPKHNPGLLPETQNGIYHSRESASFSGAFYDPDLQGEAIVLAKDAGTNYLVGGYPVTKPGSMIFRGKASVENSEVNPSFIVPDDVVSGNNGVLLAYLWDENTQQDYSTYFYPMKISDEVLPDAPPNDSPPNIELFMSSYDFRAGDKVGTSPVMYARISDENGINLTGKAGHNILLVIDGSAQPISVTDYFSYDVDSYTSGVVTYQLPKLKEGHHTVQLIAFDNFNLPGVADTHFISQDTGDISLQDLLIYPNPMKTEGYVSFIISEPAEYTLDLFTMSGRRIRRLEGSASQGFNKIALSARDDFGDRLANNTYFIRIKARSANGKSIEKQERLVIYK